MNLIKGKGGFKGFIVIVPYQQLLPKASVIKGIF